MSPRGFYSRESISPYFTSSEYRQTEQYKSEIRSLKKILYLIDKINIFIFFKRKLRNNDTIK
jgi:hypothetical protein